MIMMKMNYVILSCMMSCSLVAMKSNGLTREEFGRMLGDMRPTDRLRLETLRGNDVRKQNLKSEYKMQIENRRLSHSKTMDRESYLQRHGTPEEYFSYTRGAEL
jgi:hypothetical protein